MKNKNVVRRPPDKDDCSPAAEMAEMRRRLSKIDEAAVEAMRDDNAYRRAQHLQEIHRLAEGDSIHDTVTIDNARWLLNAANNNAFLCENILDRGANARYIIEREFRPFFKALREQLDPLVYGA